MSVPIVHPVAMLTDRGMPYAEAGPRVPVIMGSGVMGRILLGRLTDYLGGLRSYFLTSAVQTILVFWFTRVESLPLLYLLSALFGVGYSGVMTAVWVCIRELVEPRVLATSLAVVVMAAWFGMGLGGWQAATRRSHRSYHRPYWTRRNGAITSSSSARCYGTSTRAAAPAPQHATLVDRNSV